MLVTLSTIDTISYGIHINAFPTLILSLNKRKIRIAELSLRAGQFIKLHFLISLQQCTIWYSLSQPTVTIALTVNYIPIIARN